MKVVEEEEEEEGWEERGEVRYHVFVNCEMINVISGCGWKVVYFFQKGVLCFPMRDLS